MSSSTPGEVGARATAIEELTRSILAVEQTHLGWRPVTEGECRRLATSVVDTLSSDAALAAPGEAKSADVHEAAVKSAIDEMARALADFDYSRMMTHERDDLVEGAKVDALDVYREHLLAASPPVNAGQQQSVLQRAMNVIQTVETTRAAEAGFRCDDPTRRRRIAEGILALVSVNAGGGGERTDTERLDAIERDEWEMVTSGPGGRWIVTADEIDYVGDSLRSAIDSAIDAAALTARPEAENDGK